MLWPVLLDTDPRDTMWSLGERVSTRLRWLDDPDLSDDLVLHQVVVRASTLPDFDGRPWAQLVEAGDLRAVREGDHRAGEVTLDGCLGFDVLLGIIGELPVTVGIVRRVRVVQDLYDRGTDGWIRRPGEVRLTDVPDACPSRLRDDPSFDEPMPDAWKPQPGTVQVLSAEEYFRLARDQLPEEHWQARGFLIDLDVTDPPESTTKASSDFGGDRLGADPGYPQDQRDQYTSPIAAGRAVHDHRARRRVRYRAERLRDSRTVVVEHRRVRVRSHSHAQRRSTIRATSPDRTASADAALRPCWLPEHASTPSRTVRPSVVYMPPRSR